MRASETGLSFFPGRSAGGSPAFIPVLNEVHSKKAEHKPALRPGFCCRSIFLLLDTIEGWLD